MRINFRHQRTQRFQAGEYTIAGTARVRRVNTQPITQEQRNRMFDHIQDYYNQLNKDPNAEVTIDVVIPAMPRGGRSAYNQEELKNKWLDVVIKRQRQLVSDETNRLRKGQPDLDSKQRLQQANDHATKVIHGELAAKLTNPKEEKSAGRMEQPFIRAGSARVRRVVRSEPPGQADKERLQQYIINRKNDPNEFHGIAFFQGRHKSKTVKVAAAEILQKIDNGERASLEDYPNVSKREIKAALKDSRLERIAIDILRTTQYGTIDNMIDSMVDSTANETPGIRK